MSRRPHVALISYHLAAGRVERWTDGGFAVPARYVERLRAAGARTSIVPPGEPGRAEEVLDPFDALVLVGGGDVEPHRYGHAPGDRLYGLEPDRDQLEIDLLLGADHLGTPALCICRGMQVMNVAFGGTLHAHLPAIPGLLEHGVPSEDTVSTHDVRLEPGSRVAEAAGAEVLACSSHHHQGVDALGAGLVATGRSADGLVEAIERDGSGWLVGVQWHPEDTAPTDPRQQGLFDALIRRARS